jgi:hypothetical protein
LAFKLSLDTGGEIVHAEDDTTKREPLPCAWHRHRVLAESITERLAQRTPRAASMWRACVAATPAPLEDPDEIIGRFAKFLLTESDWAGNDSRIIGSAVRAVAAQLTA